MAWLVQLNPPVKGLRRLFPLLEQQHQVPAGKRYPLVLQLDTFVETIGHIPVLRGPRLHTLKALLCTSPKGDRPRVALRRQGVRGAHSTSPGWRYASGCQARVGAPRSACSLLACT